MTMGRRRDTQGTSLNIRHILKDGTVLKDITGYKVPRSNPVYGVMERKEMCHEKGSRSCYDGNHTSVSITG